jgi:hypothetical protein
MPKYATFRGSIPLIWLTFSWHLNDAGDVYAELLPSLLIYYYLKTSAAAPTPCGYWPIYRMPTGPPGQKKDGHTLAACRRWPGARKAGQSRFSVDRNGVLFREN